MLSTDSFFSLGQAHIGQGKPCQDFALSGLVGNAAFAIVADGCSTGGLTDVGSRIITLSTAQAIIENIGSGNITEETLNRIKTQQQAVMIASRRMLGLSKQDMLATCVFAVLSPSGGFIHLQGDGVFALKFKMGHIMMFRYDWAENAPAYPVYAEDNYSNFITFQGGDLEANKLKCELWDYVPDIGLRDINVGFNQLGATECSLGEGISGNTFFITEEHLNGGLEFITVFSDGVTQIEGQDWKQAVIDLLAFKNVEGEFAKRRMIRHIKDSQKVGKGPIDDIAYSVIRVVTEVHDANPE